MKIEIQETPVHLTMTKREAYLLFRFIGNVAVNDIQLVETAQDEIAKELINPLYRLLKDNEEIHKSIF